MVASGGLRTLLKENYTFSSRDFVVFYFDGGFSEALFFLLGSKVDYKGR